MRKIILIMGAFAFLSGLFSCKSGDKVNYGKAPGNIRVATFNTSLYRMKQGKLIQDLRSADNEQASSIAEIIQRLRPDVLVLQEFDYDQNQIALDLFCKNYLEKNQNGAPTIHYPFRIAFNSNTGIPSGFDLNKDGKINTPEDAFGYGEHPGQYAFAVISKYPFNKEEIRTFQKFVWNDMPEALVPTDTNGKAYYNDSVLSKFRLSSKNHVDLPIMVHEQKIHALISHPTPPVFDGPENRNGKRNHDEIRFWADYVDESRARYIYDDFGSYGGLPTGEYFVLLGDMNADPEDGDSHNNAINQLLNHPAFNQKTTTGEYTPWSEGGAEYYEKNSIKDQTGNPKHHTSVFGLRLDYVLPSKNLRVTNSGIYWPPLDEEHSEIIKNKKPSDHRMVWVDFKIPLNKILKDSI
ncbi:MAG: endonuclease/exonuclease/phosphatase family protein [Bacteroidales bacterium]|nr:endonuclease/exonuclease/phosphatase family protein [Bacteroidales bacterium]